MKKTYLLLLIAFVIQAFLIFKGADYWGNILNVILFFFVSLAIPVFVLSDVRQYSFLQNRNHLPASARQGLLFAGVAFVSVLLSFEEIRKLFIHYPMPTPDSDVMQQLETQYERFANGIFPYAPVTEISYQPYPVYMPMHWMPIGFCKWLHIDIRWSGFLIYAISSAIFGYFTGKQKAPMILKYIFSFMPSVVVWFYILFGGGDLMITLEILIAGYYLILASGLLLKNNALILTGIILCLLSRYTLIFWLPLFGILFWVNHSYKKSVWFICIIVTAVCCFYIIPFLMKDPDILSKGVNYHNNCAIAEWEGPFYTARHGINFAYAIKQITGNDCVYGVTVNRILQAVCLLLTLASGLFIYFRNYKKYDLYDLSLWFLYIFMLVFYVFCPLTYRYYLVVLLILSVAVAATLLSYKKPESS